MPRARKRKSTSAITMETVARRAGLSAMSVSKVLNGRKVRPETREAVLRAVEELQFTPNAAARQLASATTLQIALLYHDPRQTFFSDLLVGALNAATRLGVQLILHHVAFGDAEQTWHAVRTLRNNGISAVLLPPVFCEVLDRHMKIAELGIPMIGLAPGTELSQIASIRIDDLAAARELTELLIGKGHHRIGFIRAPASLSIHESRFAGYRDALRERGIAFDPLLVVEGSLTFESALAATAELLDLDHPPTAIFASNDDMAAGALMTAQIRGLTVPTDIMIAGFDDGSIATKVFPPLTSVRLPITQMVGLAMDKLAEVSREGFPQQPALRTTYFGYSLVRRASTGD